MGQILIIEGEDFSANPNAINVNELPLITDGLIGYYTGHGSTADDDDMILYMPSVIVEGKPFVRFPGYSESPTLFRESSFFNGLVMQSSSINGLISDDTILNLSDGVSFSFYIRMSAPTTSSISRVVLSIPSIMLQFWIRRVSGEGHISIGTGGSTVRYDVGFHGVPAGVNAITLTLTQSSVTLYMDGSSLGTANISGSSLPEVAEGLTFLANWTNSSGPINDQVKNFYVHNRVLSLPEIQLIHSGLSEVTP